MGNTISIEPTAFLAGWTVTSVVGFFLSMPIIPACVSGVIVGGFCALLGHYLYLKDNGERFGNKKVH